MKKHDYTLTPMVKSTHTNCQNMGRRQDNHLRQTALLHLLLEA